MKLSIRIQNQTINVNVSNMLTLNLDLNNVEEFVTQANSIALLFGKEIPVELMPMIKQIIKLYLSVLKNADGVSTFEYDSKTNELTMNNQSSIKLNIFEVIEMVKTITQLQTN